MDDPDSSPPSTPFQQQREREQEHQEQKQRITLAFIEHQLPAFHPAFADAPVHWEEKSHQFVPNNFNVPNNSLHSRQALAALPVPENNHGSTPLGVSLTLSSFSLESLLPPREAWTDVNAMMFWNSIFNAALAKFKDMPEPKGLSKSTYSIRDKSDWHAVYATLELARERYKGEGGRIGWFRQTIRKAADNVAPLAAATNIAQTTVPVNPYSTPVLAAVGVLLDAIKQAALVRKKVLEGFDDLMRIFSDIEVFVGTFYRDANITKASVELTTTTLDAIEKAIEFFISNEFKRASKALLKRGEYEDKLLKSLEEINTKSTMLIGEAEKSHIHESHQAHLFSQVMQSMMAQRQWEMDQRQRQMDQRQRQMDQRQRQMDQRQQQIEKKIDNIDTKLFNSLNGLFMDHETNKDARNAAEIAAKERLLAAKDVQITDLRKEVYYADERTMSTQEKNTHLVIENQRLRSATASPMFSLLVLPPPGSQKPVMQWTISQSTLQETLDTILNTSELDTLDIAFISSKKGQLPEKQRARAEQIVNQSLFRNWLTSAFSTKLLVQWDSHLPQTIAEVSPLSVFCTSMVHLLANKDRFMSIQWFCGQHLAPVKDNNGKLISSGRVMLLGLISQLLRAHTFDTYSLSLYCKYASLNEGRIDEDGLLALLGWLVRQLPQTTTLICFIDGVLLYERDEHGGDALRVLAFLLGLTTAGAGVAASVKVLFTSTPGPRTVRAAFKDEGLMLDVGMLPQLEWTTSEARMARGMR